MYIEVRRIGKAKAYYLGHSFREGGKIHKIRRFLGTNLTEEQIKGLRAKAERIMLAEIQKYQIINDPLTRELNPRELKIIKKLQDKIKLEVNHLSKDDWKRFTEAFTYDTNAIEGSTVSSGEVKGILEENNWPKDKQKWEISETYGVSEAITELRKNQDHLSLALVLKLHKICFRNSKGHAGQLRQKGVEVCVRNQIGDVLHVGAPSDRIKSLLNELVRWYQKNKSRYPPLLLAAVVHNQFETIHPFQDGNGRVGRLLLNNILIKHGFPPINITLARRSVYYGALQAYQKGGDVRPIIELIVREYKRFYKNT